ncbi:MAG: hypothetical protein OER92_06385 [Alphaproteobacteria bacterium]|nr:hypothetical protein [Alphaproteobacteria bacterium]
MHALLLLGQVIFSLKRNTRGGIAAEYAFLLVFIAIVAVSGALILGDGLANYFSAMGNTIGGSAQQS